MSKSSRIVHKSKPKQQTKRTPLDKFNLFYEEIPMKIEAETNAPATSKSERLVRRSRS